jgi:hypothetical protein
MSRGIGSKNEAKVGGFATDFVNLYLSNPRRFVARDTLSLVGESSATRHLTVTDRLSGESINIEYGVNMFMDPIIISRSHDFLNKQACEYIIRAIRKHIEERQDKAWQLRNQREERRLRKALFK